MHVKLEPSLRPETRLISIAREAISAFLADQQYEPTAVEEADPQWRKAAGIFVTLFRASGELRGCIGRHARCHPHSLEQEIADCAVIAATEDPRFPVVSLRELEELVLEISLLHPHEKVHDERELDPETYGIIVRAGHRAGTLLPGIEGVETVEQQLKITRRKAGIPDDQPVELFRFKVTKITE